MKLEKLSLLGFRNHSRTDITCSPTVNLFVGRNGQGKTKYVIYGSFRSDSGVGYSVGIRYTSETRKKEIKINNKEEERVSALVGKFPVVILYPEQHSITNGGPAERRRFIDIVLSQAHPRYFEMLTEYRRILRHRNAILTESRGRGQRIRDLLAPWDQPFLEYAVGITAFRDNFISELNSKLRENYGKIVDGDEAPSLKYEPSIAVSNSMTQDEQHEKAEQAFKTSLENEVRYGTTIFGPHRDELLLLINDLEVRKYASQGQQKSFLVALKISESHYLLEKRNEQPLILLDDLFGELDRERSRHVLELTSGMGQTFVTSADESIGETHYTSLNGHIQFVVSEGRIINV
jgi:DNA replication and repair protein RecF